MAGRHGRSAETAHRSAGPVVTPDWLERRLKRGGSRLIHVSPNRRVYNRRHIPGAIFSDLHRDLALRGHSHETGDAEREWLLPDREHVERLLGRWGAGDGDEIVLYDDVGLNRHAIRGYWVLRLYRFPKDRLHILDGGIEAWTRGGRKTTTTLESPERADPARTPVRLGERDDSLLATYDEVLAWSRESARDDGPTRLLDVRTAGEFVGTDVRSKRGGHISGARHRDFQDFVAADGTLRPVEQSLALLRATGVDPADVRATYCQGAVRAALAWFVLHELAGLDGVKSYGGSWEEWGNRDDSPIAIPGG